MADEVLVSTMPSGAAALVIWPGGEEVFYREEIDAPAEAAAELATEIAAELGIPVTYVPQEPK